MSRKGRKSHADQIIEELEDTEDAEGHFLVLYDFDRKPGKPVHHSFFKNIKRIFLKLGDGRRLQFSVIECRRLKTAKAIIKLAERFNAREVVAFKIEKMLDS